VVISNILLIRVNIEKILDFKKEIGNILRILKDNRVGLCMVAKEVEDGPIYHALGESGHSIKHLAAAVS
jgi:hypothetical protein